MRSSRCPQGAYLNLKTKTIQLIWVSSGQGITRWCLSYCQVNSKEKEKMWLDISKAFATEGLVGGFQEGLVWAETRVGLKGMAARTPKGLERVLATVWDGLFISKTGLEKFAAAERGGEAGVWAQMSDSQLIFREGEGNPELWCIALETEDEGWAPVKRKTWLMTYGFIASWAVVIQDPRSDRSEHPEFPHSNIFS